MRGVVVVLSGFPRRSETFAVGELDALDRAGLLQMACALKPGDGLAPHPDSMPWARRVRTLPGTTPAEQAAAIAAAVGGDPPLAIHGYFAHAPADVAEHAAARLGVPFGFSVHARDARKVAPGELVRRSRRARCVVTCNRDALATLDRVGVQARLVPHGVDLARFAASPMRSLQPPVVLAVGRLVPKKGFDVLLDALACAREPWAMWIAGEGPEHDRLRRQAERLGVAARVRWLGSVTHRELPALYRTARLVAVPSVVDASGDRDGLPNVVLEAMASGRPVVGSRAGDIASAVIDGHTGLLVPPHDARALATGIDQLMRDEASAARLGRRARAFVERTFDRARCGHAFTRTLAEAYA